MRRYAPLAEFLSSHKGDSCTLTVPEIERIIGRQLPPSARVHPAWWGNDRSHAQARAWMGEGWRARPATRQLDAVVFRRVGGSHPWTAAAGKDGGTAQVIVRGLDRGAVERLKRRAREAGRSLEAELRRILTQAARPDRGALLAEADRIRAMTPGPLTDSTVLLREDRDRP
ncbi:MAG: hypothetical protein OXM56_07400 [Gammaproteobacteria bacterium]|nr:hypothetical protein [Gammaproteobacteria bacterium]